MDYEFLRSGLDDQVDFQKHCTVFLERMRHSSSFELVQRVKSFINHFYGTQGSVEEYSEQIHRFLEEVSIIIKDHPLWKDKGSNEIQWAMEAMEGYLLTNLHKITYYLPNSTDEEDDEKFYLRVRTLQFLQPKHLDIPDRPLNKVAIELAAEELAFTDNEKMKSPLEKLTCILNSITVITNLLKHYAQEKGTGADDLLPYIIYTTLLLSPKHMHSNLRFIKRFRRESEMKSEAAYYFTQLDSAVMFIMDLNYRNLSISKEEFETGLRESEELVQTGLDIPTFSVPSKPHRPRLSSSSTVTDATSPIVTRRACVIQEWNRLQRTHSMSSKLTGEKKQTDKMNRPTIETSQDTSTSISCPLDHPLMSTSVHSSPVQLHTVGGSPSQFVEGDYNREKMLASKVLEARFEEMTVSELKHIFTNYQSLVRKRDPVSY